MVSGRGGTGGGRGTNQYQVRGHAKIPAPAPIVTLASPPETNRRRCGEVWGTKCRIWIGAPSWSHGEHPSTTAMLATTQSSSTSAEILTLLAGDESWNVRYWVAQNLSTPPEVLARLAGDEKQAVRLEVARHLDTPVEALFDLALDENRYVREAAHNNPNLPEPMRAIAVLDAGGT